ncbi:MULTISPECIES: alkaline phosphatase D family protein [Thermomonospora]|uniref:Alkaline phosphatase n=1 Tax=Thermomonospora curvata (strain ATCC 19995 / DSM 43183 / JCM 3096 / KCTC 9072 / NBRC 15933 / NCIMB 10081 / Henssen B9) TaxID=471852 RepID=D1A729_THECD|nr:MULTISPECIES: alkaline phosphatase D family protein [Thermomonospora]ACY98433.1 Alkaline phosphatase [Thermomonospora curvata DSM 43183]PKK13583.1 MAG: alkaline phosphatase [Thermomonospora sp. CIF 1]
MTLLDRRGFLRVGGAGALAIPSLGLAASGAHAAPSRYFRHGVASGDPLPTAVIIWTRVTPTASSLPGSGAGPVVDVGWQVARDAAFRKIVARGTFRTGPDRDHTVKVDVRGLAPGTVYYYRFLLDGSPSPVGRTRTAPPATARVPALKLGVVSCANWEAGHFAAYRHLAARDDLFGIVHLGDYIYEYASGDFAAGGRVVRPNEPRHEILTLADYRMRHALYKTDPDLQALHARFPWMIVWDDHEVANDAWAGGAQNHDPATEGPYAARLAASRRAYFEWMPVRVKPGGAIYRRLRFGRLAELTLLDLRGYRSRQERGIAVDDPARTITGTAQMRWLKEGLSASKGEVRWRLIGNSVMISPVAVGAVPARLLGPLGRLLGVPAGGFAINPDQWDGYTADRKQLLGHLHRNRIGNTIFLTGDIHTCWANEVPLDAATYPRSPAVATEMVVPSVTSDNIDDLAGVPPRTLSLAAEGALAVTNRHVRWAELDSHGYGVIGLTPERARMDWFALSDRTRRDASSRRLASFAVPSGSPTLKRLIAG